jgi:hypothetical protein
VSVTIWLTIFIVITGAVACLLDQAARAVQDVYLCTNVLLLNTEV